MQSCPAPLILSNPSLSLLRPPGKDQHPPQLLSRLFICLRPPSTVVVARLGCPVALRRSTPVVCPRHQRSDTASSPTGIFIQSLQTARRTSLCCCSRPVLISAPIRPHCPVQSVDHRSLLPIAPTPNYSNTPPPLPPSPPLIHIHVSQRQSHNNYTRASPWLNSSAPRFSARRSKSRAGPTIPHLVIMAGTDFSKVH